MNGFSMINLAAVSLMAKEKSPEVRQQATLTAAILPGPFGLLVAQNIVNRAENEATGSNIVTSVPTPPPPPPPPPPGSTPTGGGTPVPDPLEPPEPSEPDPNTKLLERLANTGDEIVSAIKAAAPRVAAGLDTIQSVGPGIQANLEAIAGAIGKNAETVAGMVEASFLPAAPPQPPPPPPPVKAK